MYANAYRLNLSSDGKDHGVGCLNYTHVERYWQQLLKLRFQSKAQYNGFYKSGFRVFDHRKEKVANDDTEIQIDG
jgi:hypothetical protein